MTLTATYSTTQQAQDALSFIMQTRYITASAIIRELILNEAKRLNFTSAEPQAKGAINRNYTHIVSKDELRTKMSTAKK